MLVCGSCLSCDLFNKDDGNKSNETDNSEQNNDTSVVGYASVEGIPDYSGEPYVVLNNNQPEFDISALKPESYEKYSSLDSLGRCGVTEACVGKDIMPTDERGDIGSVYPTGWENNKYDTELVSGGYIYNRCHLIGWQLTGEDANKSNLITGTRYLNIEGMLPFENMVADYVKETGNHVMYRVTPIFVGNNLLASGVKMEAYSVEDNGDGICFNVFAYNVQPGITIKYATGENWLNGDEAADTSNDISSDSETSNADFILNKNSKKFHLPTCSDASKITSVNREEYVGSREALIAQKYTACGKCNP